MRNPFRLAFAPLCLGVLLAAPALAQEEPQGTFSWAMQPKDLGTVAAPAVELDSSWRPGPFGISYRAPETLDVSFCTPETTKDQFGLVDSIRERPCAAGEYAAL